jgi:ferric-dicitrate binding protein FerR (iron transport regulator)
MEKEIRQYLEGNLSKKEQRELLLWLRNAANKPVFDAVKEAWWLQKLAHAGQMAPSFEQLHLSQRLKEKQQLKKTQRYVKLYRYAAIALLVISLAGGLFFSQLYLKGKELRYTEIRTAFGQISEVTLPDGSEVWINSGTKLSYNNQYGINNREVKVAGEAFFSVVKNKAIPLIVALGDLQVKVTGTQFEVSNYDDSKTIEVVLETGSLEIYPKSHQSLTRLFPGEMGSFNRKTMILEKGTVNPKHYTSWRYGIMNIFELPLEQVAQKIEKRYNQKFEVDPRIKDMPFTFSIENESLAEVLYLLGKISPVKAVQEGNIIRLKYEQKF